MSNRQKWLYTAAILISMVFLAMSHQLRSTQLSSVIEFYGLTSSAQGVPTALSTLGSMTSMFIAIALNGRVRKQYMLITAIAASMLMMLPQSFCPPYVAFLAANYLCGVALGVIDTLVSACIAEVHTGKTAALMMCMLHASYGVGGITSPALFGNLLAGGMAWNRLFFVLIGIGLAIFLYVTPVALRQARLTPVSGKAEGAVFSIAALKEFFSDPILATCTGIMFCFGVAFNGMTGWMVRFVDVNYSSTLGATTLSMVFVGLLIGRVVPPFLPIPEKGFLKVAGIGYFVCMMLPIFIGTDVATAVCACIACIIAGPILPYAISIACGRMLKNTLMCSTILNLALYVGQTIASPIMGAIESFSGLESAMSFCHSFGLICSLLAIVGLRSLRKAKA